MAKTDLTKKVERDFWKETRILRSRSEKGVNQ